MRVGERANIAVAEHGHRNGCLDRSDHVPVGAHESAALVLARAAVHGDERRAGALEHAGVGEGVGELWEDSDLRAHGRLQLLYGMYASLSTCDALRLAAPAICIIDRKKTDMLRMWRITSCACSEWQAAERCATGR